MSAEVPEAPAVPPHIVDAARHVLAQDGLAAATLERISRQAGVSRMTLHRHGLSKQQIIRAIADRLEADYREAMWPALVAQGTARERLTDALERLLLDGAADGSLALLDAEETATVLFNVVGHTYAHLRVGHQWSPERARGGVISVAIEGVTPP